MSKNKIEPTEPIEPIELKLDFSESLKVRSLDFEEMMTSADHSSSFDNGHVALFD